MSRKFEVLLRWISSFGIVKSAAVLAAVAVIAALSCVNHISTISSCSMIIYVLVQVYAQGLPTGTLIKSVILEMRWIKSEARKRVGKGGTNREERGGRKRLKVSESSSPNVICTMGNVLG